MDKCTRGYKIAFSLWPMAVARPNMCEHGDGLKNLALKACYNRQRL